MKIVRLSLASVLFASAIGAFAQTHPSQVWVPPGDLAAPYHVRYAVYDLRYNRIQFRLEENNTDYFYFFNPSDELSLMKANAIYATLLTAKTTGEGVYTYVVDGATKSVNTVQLGPNN